MVSKIFPVALIAMSLALLNGCVTIDVDRADEDRIVMNYKFDKTQAREAFHTAQTMASEHCRKYDKIASNVQNNRKGRWLHGGVIYYPDGSVGAKYVENVGTFSAECK